MILWHKTEQTFGRGEEETRKMDWVIVACDVCGVESKRRLQQHKQTTKRKGQYLCHRCAVSNKDFKEQCSHKAKQLWKDEEYKSRNLQSVRSEEYRRTKSQEVLDRWKDPEYRQKMNSKEHLDRKRKTASNNLKKKWDDPEFRNHMCALARDRMIKKWEDPEYREEMKSTQSKNSKLMWSKHRDKLMATFGSDEFLAKMKRINTEINNRPEVKRKISEASVRMWDNPEFRDKMIQLYYGSQDYKDKLSRNAKDLWKNDQYRAVYNTEEFRDACRIASKRLWNDAAYIAMMHKIYNSQEFVDACRQFARQLWRDPEYIIKMQQLFASDSYRNKCRDAVCRASGDTERSERLRLEREEEFINKSISLHGNLYNYDMVDYVDNMRPVKIVCPRHGPFEQKPKLHVQGCGCPICAQTMSRPQVQIGDWIKNELQLEVLINDRNAIKPLELDIFSPHHSFAIEYHGLYWHSYDRPETLLEKRRHADKANVCDDNSITLLQIFENEWIHKQPIVKSMIANRLGKSEKIYGRQCKIVNLDNDTYNHFMENSHLQGPKNASVKYGLIFDDNVVASMSFNRHHKYGWEITRFANKLHTTVVGGAGRLFNQFIKDVGPNSILTYADRRYSNGNLYKRLGFSHDGVTSPNYSYVKDGAVFSRQQFQKHKLKDKLENFDPNLTEAENMFNNGYRRLWDAGHMRFLWIHP